MTCPQESKPAVLNNRSQTKAKTREESTLLLLLSIIHNRPLQCQTKRKVYPSTPTSTNTNDFPNRDNVQFHFEAFKGKGSRGGGRGGGAGRGGGGPRQNGRIRGGGGGGGGRAEESSGVSSSKRNNLTGALELETKDRDLI